MGRDVASRQTAVITNNGIVCAGPGLGRAAGARSTPCCCYGLVSALLGFNPWWDTEFEFEVAVPDLALVRFMVEDYDSSSKNDFIGQSTIPWNCLKQGYRHVHLLSKNGDQHPSATLFVKISIQD